MRQNEKTFSKKLTNLFTLIEETKIRDFSLVSHKIELDPFRNISLEVGGKTPLRIKY